LGGGTPSGLSSTNFTYSTGPTVTPIADIQTDLGTYEGQIVTVEGVVYISSAYRLPDTTVFSGFIQDSSGRGINDFGFDDDPIAGDAALQTVGNRVRVTGTVTRFNTTIEIASMSSVELLETGVALPPPAQLSTGAAASSQWEGTYIEITADVISSTTGGPGRNYTVNDGTGPLDVRVVDTLRVPVFADGTTITARGAGGQFGTVFQVLVGRAVDVFEDGGGPDLDPPIVVGATATSATNVTVSFNEALDPASAQVAGNYSVYLSSNPSATVPVSTATLTGSNVALVLGTALSEAESYTVEVSNVQDVAGNVIAGNNTATFSWTAVAVTPIADIQTDLGTYEGQVVTVEGVVYIPSTYRQPDTSVFSGYIQDSSGRGINVFGFSDDPIAGDAALQTVGNRVRVTGTVTLFNTTVELESLSSVELLETGVGLPPPAQLSTGAAASSQWEGTFIEITADVISSTTGGPGRNYTVDDGSGSLVVRVVDTLGVPVFADGTTITARGAGGQFQTDFQILVGNALDVFEDSGGDTEPPIVVSASAQSESVVRVSFNEVVDSGTASVPGNYELFESANPSMIIGVVGASPTGANVSLALQSALSEDVDYTVRVSNVEDLAGNVIAGNNTATFSYTAGGVIPIATIQADPSAFDGQEVTVQGQIYIPTDYRGTLTSGYIQDDSGRGINLFGSGADVPALRDVTNVVRVTGTVTLYFTTVEIENITDVQLISTGNPPLQPTRLSITQAASSAWEGTYIEVNGEIQSQSEPGNPPSAVNYTLAEGNTLFDVRVVFSIDAPRFSTGTRIWARGAGGQFQDTYQLLVGRAADIQDEPFPDQSPPTVLRAFFSGASEITLSFNEGLERNTAEMTGNYTVRTAQGGSAAVSQALLSGDRTVILTLALQVDPDDNWLVDVVGVADIDGNTITTPQTIAVERQAPTSEFALDGPVRTFLPRLGEEYPLTMVVPEGFVQGGFQLELLLRVFDLQGRLQRTLYDSRFDPANADFADGQHEVTWNGRDEYAEFVPAGAYVAHLHIVERTSGEKHQFQMPVVVASRLER
jgi:hypothetical protein